MAKQNNSGGSKNTAPPATGSSKSDQSENSKSNVTGNESSSDNNYYNDRDDSLLTKGNQAPGNNSPGKGSTSNDYDTPATDEQPYSKNTSGNSTGKGNNSNDYDTPVTDEQAYSKNTSGNSTGKGNNSNDYDTPVTDEQPYSKNTEGNSTGKENSSNDYDTPVTNEQPYSKNTEGNSTGKGSRSGTTDNSGTTDLNNDPDSIPVFEDDNVSVTGSATSKDIHGQGGSQSNYVRDFLNYVLADFPPQPIPHADESANYDYLNPILAYRDTIYALIRGEYQDYIEGRYIPQFVTGNPEFPGIRDGIHNARDKWDSIPSDLKQLITSNARSLFTTRYQAVRNGTYFTARFDESHGGLQRYLAMKLDLKIAYAIAVIGVEDPITYELRHTLFPQGRIEDYVPRLSLMRPVV